MAIDIRLDSVTGTGAGCTAYVQLVDSASGKILESFSCNYDQKEKERFAAAVKAKIEAFLARNQQRDAVRNEISAILAQIKTEIGG